MDIASYASPQWIDGRQVRMARQGLNLSVRQLAELAGLNKATIVRIEAGVSVRQATLQSVRAALETLGAEFYYSGDLDRVAVSVTRATAGAD